jgi:hypothetical protein
MTKATRKLTHQAIDEIVGRVSDATAKALIATGASEEELLEARQWAAGDSSLAKDKGRPLDGIVAALYDILTAESGLADEEEERRR